MFQRIIHDWNLWRFLRLGIAIILLFYGINGQDNFLIFITLILFYQTIFNVGCFGGSCTVPQPKNKEELK